MIETQSDRQSFTAGDGCDLKKDWCGKKEISGVNSSAISGFSKTFLINPLLPL
jgi:hypothetical protein